MYHQQTETCMLEIMVREKKVYTCFCQFQLTKNLILVAQSIASLLTYSKACLLNQSGNQINCLRYSDIE